PTPAVALDEVDVHYRSVAFGPDGRFLAFGQGNGVVSVYDLTTGKRLQQLAIGAAPAHLAFHPHDRRLAVACGNVVRLFDIPSGRELPALRHTPGDTRVDSVAWRPDGRHLAAGCDDRKIH